jgi:predicted DCC family thiol-disulfide oxidoreductase YuxK
MTIHPILYDPDCGFCRFCVAVLLRWDRHRRLRPVPGQELESWQLVMPDGSTQAAGAAFSPLFRLLPGGAPLARLTDRFPEASDRAYRWVADRRSTFGKLLPDAVRRWADHVISESEPDGR